MFLLKARRPALPLLSSLLVFALTSAALAKDFAMRNLPHAQDPTFDLKSVAGKMSYYEFMHMDDGLGRTMLKVAPQAKSGSTNEQELRAGRGISVKLGENNYNVHINFPMKPTGGRSYGWTSGQVGDWSDRMYLDNLFDAIEESNEQEMGKFYQLIVRMLGACESDEQGASIEALRRPSQRVAANFLAIYTAEQYRSMVPQPHHNWDDALLQTTLLAAFHAGQKEFTKFYLTRFSTEAKEQDSGVYAKTRPGSEYDEAEDKHAEMNDYWQFSANPTSKQSGINITRVDFEKMGEAITEYERDVAKSRLLAKVQATVHGDRNNVIKSISEFFVDNKSKNVRIVDELSRDVAALMQEIRENADEITAWIKARSRGGSRRAAELAPAGANFDENR